ncbi:MAG: S-formylglutathione hydrolase [Paracoccaceae bacterium]
MKTETVSTNRCFGGTQHVLRSTSPALGGETTWALYEPPQAARGPVPVLWWLSGLTCTHENAMTKAGLQAHAARMGLAVAYPDTSPRGEGVPDDEAFDLGVGAGFYLDATQAPWAERFGMETHVTSELPAALPDWCDRSRMSVAGHSMGGHGALTLAMRHPGAYRSASAFAPICNPTASDWGRKQFDAYLGGPSDEHDATRLIADRGCDIPLMIDTGTDDQFGHLLGTEAFAAAAIAAGADLQLGMRKGYDHSYFFVATYAGAHVRFHAKHLR